uniref:Uncharacterized protein n=1 Tax=Glossina pallidipes TaxID=7398 RepID=A0A1A9ZGW5_GLOPL
MKHHSKITFEFLIGKILILSYTFSPLLFLFDYTRSITIAVGAIILKWMKEYEWECCSIGGNSNHLGCFVVPGELGMSKLLSDITTCSSFISHDCCYATVLVGSSLEEMLSLNLNLKLNTEYSTGVMLVVANIFVFAKR